MKNSSIKKDLRINRRQVIKAGLVGGASLLVPWHLRINSAYGAESPGLEHFVDKLPRPRVLRPKMLSATRKKYGSSGLNVLIGIAQ